MKLAIMQPYLFPYIGYYQLINAADCFVVYDDVQYSKGGWINRNRLLINGRDTLFQFSIKKDTLDKRINETFFSDTNIQHEKKKLLKTLDTAYRRAPYYQQAREIIQDAINSDISVVSEFLTVTLQKTCAHLGIKTPLIVSSEMEKTEGLKFQDRVLDICKRKGATHYINAIGGMELYSQEMFASAGIALNFIKTRPIVYEQFGNEFIPNLSIIDVMMFNSPERIREMLEQYDLL